MSVGQESLYEIAIGACRRFRDRHQEHSVAFVTNYDPQARTATIVVSADRRVSIDRHDSHVAALAGELMGAGFEVQSRRSFSAAEGRILTSLLVTTGP